MNLTVQNQDTKEALMERTVAVLHRNGLKRAGKGTLTALNARVITLGLPVGKTQGAAPIGKDAPTTTTSQGEQRLAGGALAARVVDLLAAATPKFGCLMAMIPSLESVIPNWAADNIPSDTLAADGIETETHCTVMYGFNLGFDTSKLTKLIQPSKPLVLHIGKLTRFERPDYDVLKFDVNSPALMALHRKIERTMGGDITKSQHEYHPHVTVAYIKKGTNLHLNGSQFEGMSVIVRQLLYSLPEKKGRRVIDLHSTLAASLSNRVQNLLRASTPPTGEAKHHADAREEARKKYESAMQAAALVALHNRKMKQHELEAAILLLLLLTGEDSYIKVHNTLGDGGVAGGRAADQTQVLEQAQTFAQGRQPALKEFAQKFAEQVRETIKQAESEGNDPATTARELRRVSDNTSSTMAATEAQVTYGSVQIDRLARAGFKSKIWMTMDDDRVRESHRECGEQAAIPLGARFVNGLAFPGDPTGAPEEICGCRCWLAGGSR